MTKRFCRLGLGLFVVMVFLSGETFAETFEFLSFKVPPGWTIKPVDDGVAYVRPNGIGLIYFYPSYESTGSATDEFAKMWKTRVEPALPGAMPPPQTQRDGEYTVAAAGKQVSAQGTLTTVSFVAIVGKGRAIGVLTMAAGDDAVHEITTFLDTINIVPGAAVATAPAGAIDMDFSVPPGYTSERNGQAVVIKPTTLDRNTPCIYGVSPSRASKGSLEADARSAILEALPGWQIKSEHYNAMRGTAGDGWTYYWFRTDVQQMAGSSMQYLTAMTMAIPNGSNRVSIVWGFGSTGVCGSDDLHFTRLFHSLRPRGWTPDGGKAFARELQTGTWRNTESAGMAQFKFLASGRYAYGQGTSVTFGNLETRTGSVGDGAYALKGADLTLTPDSRRGVRKFRARIYDEFSGGLWLRTLALLEEGSGSPLEVRYMRVEDR